MSERRPLTRSDFNVEVPDRLVEELNDQYEAITELMRKHAFLIDHGFDHEAMVLKKRIDAVTNSWVGVCNALGKLF